MVHLRRRALPALLAPWLAGAGEPARLDRRRLVPSFAEEFDTLSLLRPGIAAGRWRTVFRGDATSPDSRTLTGNRELQVYMDPDFAGVGGTRPLGLTPFAVRDGVLSIIADRTPEALRPLLWDQPYTSGLITTRFSFAQRYGYFEMRARMPRGRGFWPAFWLLPADGSWPPEIDVVEHLGKDPARYHATVHMRGPRPDGRPGHPQEGRAIDAPDLTAAFHTYGVSWQADRLRWFLDDAEVFRLPTPPDLHGPMYLLANLAIGGDWAGTPDASTPFPARLEIDWIRAYRETA